MGHPLLDNLSLETITLNSWGNPKNSQISIYTTKKKTNGWINPSIHPTDVTWSRGHVVTWSRGHSKSAHRRRWKVWGSVQLGALLAAVVLMKTIDQVLPRTGSGILQKKNGPANEKSVATSPHNTMDVGMFTPKKTQIPFKEVVWWRTSNKRFLFGSLIWLPKMLMYHSIRSFWYFCWKLWWLNWSFPKLFLGSGWRLRA